jgi:hypothetical protein
MHFSPASCHFPPSPLLGPNYRLSTLLSNTPNLCFPLTGETNFNLFPDYTQISQVD